MHRALVLGLVFGVGCGGSDGVSGTPLLGGFEPLDGAAVIMAADSCDIPFVGVSAVSGIVIGLGDYDDVCGVMQQTDLCGTKASSRAVIAGVIYGKVGGSSIDPVGPGTYSFLKDPPTGSFRAATAQAAEVDQSCDLVNGLDRDMAGGSVTIESVTAERVTGSMSLAFDSGEAFVQPFDVAICPHEKGMCSMFTPCFDYTCVP